MVPQPRAGRGAPREKQSVGGWHEAQGERQGTRELQGNVEASSAQPTQNAYQMHKAALSLLALVLGIWRRDWITAHSREILGVVMRERKAPLLPWCGHGAIRKVEASWSEQLVRGRSALGHVGCHSTAQEIWRLDFWLLQSMGCVIAF